MSHRSMKLYAAPILLTLAFVAGDSQAVLITHNTSTTLFSENFESQTVGNNWNNNVAGQWLLDGAPLVQNAAPGAFQGSKYGFIERNAVDSFDIARAQFTPVSTGRLDLDTMVYIANPQQFLTIALGNNLSGNPPTIDANTHSYVTFQLNSTHKMEEGTFGNEDMGFDYKNSEWMRLRVGYDFANAASGYTVRLTTTDGSFLYTRPLQAINSGVEIDPMVIKFEDNGNSALFDAVPEPSMAVVALTGLGALAARRQRRQA